MNAIDFLDAQNNLPEIMEKVCENHSPLIITRPKAKSVVIMSLEDYEGYETTAYLLRNPKGAQRLLAAKAEIEAGGGTEHGLIECD